MSRRAIIFRLLVTVMLTVFEIIDPKWHRALILGSCAFVFEMGYLVDKYSEGEKMRRLIDGASLAEEFWAIRRQLQLMDDTQTADKMMSGLRMAEKKLESAPVVKSYTIEKDGRLWVAVDDIDLVKSVIVESGRWIKAFYEDEHLEEKVGKWIADRYCSECEWDKKEADYTSGWRDNYCPNCGAKMERREEDDNG